MRSRSRFHSYSSFAFGAPFGARFNDGGAGGAGGAGGDDDIQKKINEAVEKATAPLKANRDAILEEKRRAKEALDLINAQIEGLGGADGLKHLKDLRERYSKDEMGQLLGAGKYDEWFEKRAASMRKDLESKIAAATKTAADASAERDRALQNFAAEKIDTSVMQAATKAGVLDTAIEDVLLRARAMFKFDPKAGIVMKDSDGEIVIGKDGKTPVGIPEWLDEMKEKARHWFPGSRGAGAEGGVGSNGQSLSDAQIEKMSMPEYKEYRKKQGMGTGWAGRIT